MTSVDLDQAFREIRESPEPDRGGLADRADQPAMARVTRVPSLSLYSPRRSEYVRQRTEDVGIGVSYIKLIMLQPITGQLCGIAARRARCANSC